MKEKKIEFILEELDKALLFKVLYMDERFRKINKLNSYIYDGFSVCSEDCIQLLPDSVVLWGTKKERDSIYELINFKSNEERDIYKYRLLKALKSWAEYWKGWDEKENKSKERNVYIF